MDYEINLCEDDPIQNEKLVQWIGHRFPQANVHGFVDEKDLLAHMQTKKIPCIIIMDIMLKNDVNGIETAKAIKAIDPSSILIF